LTGLHATKIVSAAPFRAQPSTDPFLSPQGVRSSEFSFLGRRDRTSSTSRLELSFCASSGGRQGAVQQLRRLLYSGCRSARHIVPLTGVLLATSTRVPSRRGGNVTTCCVKSEVRAKRGRDRDAGSHAAVVAGGSSTSARSSAAGACEAINQMAGSKMVLSRSVRTSFSDLVLTTLART
jgi:hypothetical protein